jgi:hypothetical protein
MYETRSAVWEFIGAITPATAGSADGLGLKKLITGAAPPTVTGTASGLECALTSASQQQLAAFSLNDVLAFDIDDLLTVHIDAALSASFAETAFFGLASAHNATLESITAFALFKASGNNNLLISTDDNFTDKTDIATGVTIGQTVRRFTMDFGSGVFTQVPGLALGGKANPAFYAPNSRGDLRRVAQGARFDMSGYSSGLQIYGGVAKASGTNTGTLTVRRIEVVYRVAV